MSQRDPRTCAPAQRDPWRGGGHGWPDSARQVVLAAVQRDAGDCRAEEVAGILLASWQPSATASHNLRTSQPEHDLFRV